MRIGFLNDLRSHYKLMLGSTSENSKELSARGRRCRFLIPEMRGNRIFLYFVIRNHRSIARGRYLLFNKIVADARAEASSSAKVKGKLAYKVTLRFTLGHDDAMALLTAIVIADRLLPR